MAVSFFIVCRCIVCKQVLLLATLCLALGSLECIDDFFFFGFTFDVGCKIAFSCFPFQGRFRIGRAVLAGSKFFCLFTALALLDDRFARIVFIRAALFAHKKTVFTFFGCFTDHC